MGLQGYTQGGEGYIGIKITWRPDDTSNKYAWSAPDNFLLAESKALEQPFDHIEHDAYVGSRDTDRGHRHGKAAVGGPITFAAYPGNGEELWEAAFGFKASVAAITADTTAAIQNGVMSVPAAPTTTPSGTGGTLAAGTYEYAATFTTDYGETTIGAATAGDALGGATSSDALTAIPTGPPGTTGRNIYRKLGAGTFGLVHSIADNTTATWTDTGAVAGVAPPTINTSLPSGVSVLKLSAGDATHYNQGRPVLVDIGLNQEFRTVTLYNVARKELTVGLLGERDGEEITHLGSGTAVVAPACSVERFITSTDFSRDYTNMLPYLAAEDNVGGKYGYRYRGGLVDKFDLKATGAKVTLTVDLKFNKPRQLANGEGSNPSPTAFDEADSTLNDLSFEFQDGFLAIDADPDSTQVPMLQRFDDATDWQLTLSNNLKVEGPMDNTTAKRFMPGAKRKVDIKMTLLNTADYPVIYEQFVSRDRDARFFGHFALNTGTPQNPTWKARSVFCPNVRYVKSTDMQGLTDTTAENVEGVALRKGGQEKVYIYSM